MCYTTFVTVPAGSRTSTSYKKECGSLLGIIIPNGCTATRLGFQLSQDNITWHDVYKEDTRYIIVPVANGYHSVDHLVFSMYYVRILVDATPLVDRYVGLVIDDNIYG